MEFQKGGKKHEKIISLVLAMLMVFATVIVSVSADTGEFTRSEAIKMAEDAYKLVRLCQDHSAILNPKDHFDYKEVVWYATDENGRVLDGIDFDTALNGEKYIESHGYCIVEKVVEPCEEFSTYEAIENKAKALFCGDMVERINKKEVFLGPPTKMMELIDVFRPGENGELLVSEEIGTVLKYGYTIDSFGAFNIEGDTATLNVRWNYSASVGEPSTYANAKFEFRKTDEGWRIEGGTAILEMLDIIQANPETGDNSGIMIPALAVLAVISIAIPVGMRKRRRER